LTLLLGISGSTRKESWNRALLQAAELVPPAARGSAGTGRAQLHLRQVLLSTKTPVLIECLQVSNAAEHFDDEGRLVTPEIRAQLQEPLNKLATVAP
jgi:NAD(P)H-dependent FMN reductase